MKSVPQIALRLRISTTPATDPPILFEAETVEQEAAPVEPAQEEQEAAPVKPALVAQPLGKGSTKSSAASKELFKINESVILLVKKNGKASSSSKRARKHISVRCFFITDQVNEGWRCVIKPWCPTGDMTCDYMTKPLQARRSVLEVPKPDHGSGPCTGSRARKGQATR